MILMSIVILPILFATLYEKDNQPFEKHLAYILKFHKSKKIRVYQAKSIYNTGKEKGEIKREIQGNMLSAVCWNADFAVICFQEEIGIQVLNIKK